jgi:hypothetical protein
MGSNPTLDASGGEALKESMKKIALQFLAALALSCLFACSPGPNVSPRSSETERATTVRRVADTFTGKIVHTPQGYRFKPSNEPENLQRVTRAKRGEDFAAKEIDLKSYFGETIAVRGEWEHDWIVGAEIVEQHSKSSEKKKS